MFQIVLHLHKHAMHLALILHVDGWISHYVFFSEKNKRTLFRLDEVNRML